MSRLQRVRVHSLRTSALVVVLAVVASPLALLFATNAVESLFVGRTRERAMEGRDEVVALVRDAPGGVITLTDRIDAIARARDQRIRVLLPDGSVAIDRDHLVGRGWLFDLGDFIYGPDRVAVLTTFDAGRVPLRERPEVRAARTAEHAEDCDHSTLGNLEICDAAATVPLPGGAGGVAVVHAQGSSRRALDTLYASRRAALVPSASASRCLRSSSSGASDARRSAQARALATGFFSSWARSATNASFVRPLSASTAISTLKAAATSPISSLRVTFRSALGAAARARASSSSRSASTGRTICRPIQNQRTMASARTKPVSLRSCRLDA